MRNKCLFKNLSESSKPIEVRTHSPVLDQNITQNSVISGDYLIPSMSQNRPIQHEELRLAKLYQYQLLDTLPEPELDQLTALASKIINVPIALISLVDRDRQWFKSSCGIDSTETPRDISFCSHVVDQQKTLVVEDTLLDERFVTNPLVTASPYIRFYLGVPLITPDQYILGTLCIIDDRPRVVTPEQITQLELLASFVITHFEQHLKILEVEQQRRELHTIFEEINTAVIASDHEGKITKINQTATELLGHCLLGNLREILDQLSLWNDGDRELSGESLPTEQARLHGRETKRSLFHCKQLDRWLMLSVTPLRSTSSAETHETWSTLTHITDISELIQSQKVAQELKDTLSERERLATVGTLASGVGHEINNPLSYIYSNVDYVNDLLDDLKSQSPNELQEDFDELQEIVGEIKEGATRIKEIVKGLSSLSKVSENVQTIELNTLLRESLLLTKIAARGITQVLHHSLDRDVWVLGEQSRISQALVNLELNAFQSFSQADATHNCVVVGYDLREDEGVAILWVKDNGHGVSKEHRPYLFDPFFTTKRVGDGVGLGLSISKKQVLSFGGDMWFESFCEGETLTLTSALSSPSSPLELSERVSGADFYLSLPLAPQQSEHVEINTDTPDDLNSSLKARPRVFLIDDERSLLRTFERVFAGNFEVTTSFDPQAALTCCLDNPERFDVILCDVMMPDLNGVELYQILKKANSVLTQRFIFFTGGITRPELAEQIFSSKCPVILKPFTPKDVISAVTSVIANAPQSITEDK